MHSHESTTRVRLLRPDDMEAARKVVRTFHRLEIPTVRAREMVSDRSNALFVAESQGDLIGFVWAHWLDRLRTGGRQLFVYEIEVLPGHRRRGIGRRLMEAVLSTAAGEGADTFLLTNRSNVAAMALYETVGGRTENADDQLFEFPAPEGGT